MYVVVGFLLLALTTAIHAFGTNRFMKYLVRSYATSGGEWQSKNRWQIYVWTAVVLLGLHLIQALVWAVALMLMPPASTLQNFEQAMYYSLVTFTTLGYGDMTLPERIRLLSGIEAMNGIFLFGWSTALFFSVFQRFWHQDRGEAATG